MYQQQQKQQLDERMGRSVTPPPKARDASRVAEDADVAQVDGVGELAPSCEISSDQHQVASPLHNHTLRTKTNK